MRDRARPCTGANPPDPAVMFLKPVSAQYYDEIRMNQVSDAGKGAYLYLDTPEEADHALGDDERFLTIMEVAARDVQLSTSS